jgi:hypothetical protein
LQEHQDGAAFLAPDASPDQWQILHLTSSLKPRVSGEDFLA